MSNPLELGQEVLSKQGEIFGHCAKRYGLRALFGVFALVFVAFAAISFHAVLWTAFLLLFKTGPVYLYAALCVMGLDLLLVIVFVLLALQTRGPSIFEERARFSRDQKLNELKSSFALTAVSSIVFGPIGRYAGGHIFNMFRRGKGKGRK